MPTVEKVKERYGLVTLKFAPITAEPDGAHPTYGEFIDLGSAVKAYVTAQKAEGSLYGDDVLQLKVSEFSGADIQTETLLSDLEVESKLMGSTYGEDGVLTDGANDSPRAGGLAWIQKLRTKTATVFRAVFLYFATPSLPDDQSDTKGDGVTFSNNAINFSAVTDKTGSWRVRKDCTSQTEAETWLNSVRAGTAPA